MTKKANNSLLGLVSFSLIAGSLVVATTPHPVDALSLTDVVNELPLIGNNEIKEQAEPTPAIVMPVQQMPAQDLLTPIVSPIIDITQPIQELTPPTQTPAPLLNPVPAIVQPIITPKPSTTSPSKTLQPSPLAKPTSKPIASEMNIHTDATTTKIATDTSTPIFAVASTPVDTSSQANQLAAAQSNQGNLFARYMSSRISDTERNQLYAIGAGVALIGISLYMFSLRAVKTMVFPTWLRKLVTT